MVTWPRRIDWNPTTRSDDRAFILCGIADDPTWPSLKPSVTTSWPAINRKVVQKLDGPDATCDSADTTSKSSERGYTWPTLSRVFVKPR